MKILVRLFLLVPFVIFFSCKKDKTDTQDPTLTITNPVDGTNYNMFDTIKLTAEFSDETNLSSVDVVLRDMNGITAQAGGKEVLSGKSLSYARDLILTEHRLKTGNYLIEMSLSDGINVTTRTIQIHIIESPTILTGFYLAQGNSSTHSINKFDSTFANTHTISQAGSYLSSAISNYHQQLYFVNASALSFKTVNISNNQYKWSVNSLGITNSICTSDDNKIYFSKEQGNIVSYNHEGTLVRPYLCNEADYYAKHLFACGNYLIVNLEHLSTNTIKKTLIFEISTGIIKHILTDNTECVQALSHSDTELYLIVTNNSGNSIIGNLNMSTLNYYQPHTSLSKIKSATLVDSNNLLFSTEDGNIKQFTFSNGNVISLLSGANAGKLFYSGKFNKLYSAQAKNIVVYNKAAFALNFDRQYVSSDTIRDFHIIYNK